MTTLFVDNLTIADTLTLNGAGIDITGLTAGSVLSATFGALKPGGADTGIYSFPSQVGIGTAGAANRVLNMNGSAVTASSGSAYGAFIVPALTAAANNDILSGLRLGSTNTPGTFTGLSVYRIDTNAITVAAFTSPAEPRQISLGIVTGKAGADASSIVIGAVSGGDTNYLIRHTTAATFNVKAAGDITTATTLTVGGLATFNGGSVTFNNGYGFFHGSSSIPTAVSNGDGYIGSEGSTGGIALRGCGTAYEVVLEKRDGSVAFGVLTNSINCTALGTLSVDSGTGTASALTIAGSAYGAGVASLRLNGLTTAAVNNQVGTLTNAPVAGNPAFWAPISIAGTIRYIPMW